MSAVSLQGRTAIITGSSGDGMGRSIALALAYAGARVVINYGTGRPQNQAAATRVVESIVGFGGEAITVKAHTARPAEVEAMIATTVAQFGTVDILVNNASGDYRPKRLTAIKPEEWRAAIEAETDGAFLCTRAVLPLMRAQGWGRVIMMSASDIWPGGPPYDYYAGKVARLWLTRTLALHESAKNLTFNAISPGYMPQLSMDDAVAYLERGEVWREASYATAQDVADAVLYLASEEARFVTGSVISLSGHPYRP